MSYVSGGTLRGALRLATPAIAPSLSIAGEGRIYFDGTAFQISQNGGAYAALTNPTSAAGWTDDGTVVRLTTVTDGVGIGTAAPAASSKLEVLGDATRINVSITGGSPAAATGGLASLIGGAPTSGNNNGGYAQTTGGAASGSGTGGEAYLLGGAATTGTGGITYTQAGAATTGTGGSAHMVGGACTSGSPGAVNISGGSSSTATSASNCGPVNITSGNAGGAGTGSSGTITIGCGNTNAALVSGAVVISGGNNSLGAAGGTGGAVAITAGGASGGGNGATASLVGGGATSGSSGIGYLAGGNCTTGTPGAVNVQGGISTTATTATNCGPVNIFSGNAGPAGTGSSGTITIGCGNTNAALVSGGVVITGGNNTSNGTGGPVTITGGAGATTGNITGGVTSVSGGAGFGGGTGGACNLNGGAGGATGAGGSTTVSAGAGGATSGNGGSVFLTAASATSGNGGSVSISAGSTAGGGNAGEISFATTALTRSRVTRDGAQNWVGIATVSAPAVSAAGEVRFYYDSTLNQALVSMNGGAYVALTTATDSWSSLNESAGAASRTVTVPAGTLGVNGNAVSFKSRGAGVGTLSLTIGGDAATIDLPANAEAVAWELYGEIVRLSATSVAVYMTVLWQGIDASPGSPPEVGPQARQTVALTTVNLNADDMDIDVATTSGPDVQLIAGESI